MTLRSLLKSRSVPCPPATNDPGTAIDVIGRALRVLAVWDEPVETSHQDAVPCANVCVPAIRLNDIFTPMARYGTAIVEVGLRLQKVFGILAQFNAPAFETTLSDVRQRHYPGLSLP